MQGYYLALHMVDSTVTTSCELCPEGCAECSGDGAGKCLECKQGFGLDETLGCSPCPTGCKLCFRSGYCSRGGCDRSLGYYSQDSPDNLDYSICKLNPEKASFQCDGYSVEEICNNCMQHKNYIVTIDEEVPYCTDMLANCITGSVLKLTASTIEVCNRCSPHYYLVMGWYEDLDFGSSDKDRRFIHLPHYCRPCREECLSCAGPDWCIACANPNSYFREGRCLDCDPRCQTCYGPGEQCIVCADGSRASNGRCVPIDREEITLWSLVVRNSQGELRFHTMIIVFIAILAVLSIGLRITALLSMYIDNALYLKRVATQQKLWKERKLKIMQSKLFERTVGKRKPSRNIRQISLLVPDNYNRLTQTMALSNFPSANVELTEPQQKN